MSCAGNLKPRPSDVAGARSGGGRWAGSRLDLAASQGWVFGGRNVTAVGRARGGGGTEAESMGTSKRLYYELLFETPFWGPKS